MLTIKLRFNESMVINLQDSFAGPGTHWVAVYINPNTYKYFDPFGVLPPYVVVHYMQISKKEIIYNSTQVQNISSIMCGYFCISYIKIDQWKGSPWTYCLITHFFQAWLMKKQ